MIMRDNLSLKLISQAIYTINRHAKTAPEPQHLYFLKNEAIKKLLAENRAKKIGLHYSKRPKLSHQHSILLVQVGEYYFHILPTRDDFKDLPHLGTIDNAHQNPHVQMSLNEAKKIIYPYINYKTDNQPKMKQPRSRSPYYIPSSLGKMEWPPTKSRWHD